MCDVIGGYAVVVEQEPLVFVLYNAVVGGPAYHGVEQYALESEGTVGAITDGIAQQVTVTGGVAEVILSVFLVHPRGFEEAVRIACLQRLSVLVENNDRMRGFGKLEHIVA